MQRGYARTIAAWQYPVEYAFYDWANDPADLAELLDAMSWLDRYHAAISEDGSIIGFLQTILEGNSIEIGLGLRPDLTGIGHGRDFLNACLHFAAERFAVHRFTLAVATFNRRAIAVYERSGFRATGKFTQHTNGGEYPFVRMERLHHAEDNTPCWLQDR